MRKELDQMIDRFPAYRLQIIQLFLNSANFKSLCEDYLICRQSLERFKINPEQQVEFTRLSAELETEALNYLNQLNYKSN